MNTSTSIFNPEQIFQKLNEEISQLNYGENPPELYEPLRYIMDLGGKRLRPLLVLFANHLFSDNWQDAIKPAIAVEVFHNFTLMHDDIMDDAPIRRGKPTVHEKWNKNVAILSGDVMMVLAYELLLDISPEKLPVVIKAFNLCASQVCEGQQTDMNFETKNNVSEADYLEMIRKKTAVLLGFSLKLGGLIADTSTENLHLLKELGENIGIGFQLKDDLLDVFGEQAKFGKQVGGDIIANKKTFLLIEALEKAQGKELEILNFWLSQKSFDKQEKVKAVTEVYQKLNIPKITEDKINQHFKKGFDCLHKIDADENRKKIIVDFIQKLMQRDS